MPGGRPVLGAEHDHVGADASGQVAEPFGRRPAQHDVLRDVRLLEPCRSGCEQLLRLALGRLLALGAGLRRMADVRELEGAAGPREQPPERERIGVVRGAVVRDDDLRGHDSSRFARGERGGSAEPLSGRSRQLPAAGAGVGGAVTAATLPA